MNAENNFSVRVTDDGALEIVASQGASLARAVRRGILEYKKRNGSDDEGFEYVFKYRGKPEGYVLICGEARRVHVSEGDRYYGLHEYKQLNGEKLAPGESIFLLGKSHLED